MKTKRFNIQQLKLLILPIVLFIFTSSFFVSEATSKTTEKAVYVWDFTTRESKKDQLTSKFTHDFESTLVQSGCYKVLERRNYDRLIAQIDNEKAIGEIANISPNTLNNLKSLQADMVIFGEVFDDKDSGEIKITVTFQTFDGKKKLMEGIRILRGKVNDAETREIAMRKLVKKLCAKILHYGISRQAYDNTSKEREIDAASGPPKIQKPSTYKTSAIFQEQSVKNWKLAMFHFENLGDDLKTSWVGERLSGAILDALLNQQIKSWGQKSNLSSLSVIGFRSQPHIEDYNFVVSQHAPVICITGYVARSSDKSYKTTVRVVAVYDKRRAFPILLETANFQSPWDNEIERIGWNVSESILATLTFRMKSTKNVEKTQQSNEYDKRAYIECYKVKLILPSIMDGAEVFVDNKPAQIVSRIPTEITILVDSKTTNHSITVTKGNKSCHLKTLIHEDKELYLCK